MYLSYFDPTRPDPWVDPTRVTVSISDLLVSFLAVTWDIIVGLWRDACQPMSVKQFLRAIDSDGGNADVDSIYFSHSLIIQYQDGRADA